MQNEYKIFEVNQKIRSYNANEMRESSIVALIDFFNDAAWEHSSILNIGTEQLLAENKNWVLYSMQFQFFNFPKWGEEILIRTWASGTHRIFATREVEIYNAKNKFELIACGTSSWFIIDLQTRRPMRPNIYDIMKNNILDKRFDNLFGETINFPENMIELYEVTAQYSELDWNGHVNNSNYIKWALDTIPNMYKNNFTKLKDVVVNYLGQAKIGELYGIVSKKIASNKYITSIFSKYNKNEYCRIQSTWEEEK